MKYKLDIRSEPDYLHAKVTGIRSMATIMAIAEECQKACDKYGHQKLLIDARRMTGGLSTLDIYDLGRKDLGKLRRRFRLKAAVLDLEQNRYRFQFFETVLFNNGFDIRFFCNADDARLWLRESRVISRSSDSEAD